MKRVLFALVAILAFVAVGLIGEGTAWGQSGSTTIRGTITDAQGKLILNATVTIKDAQTGFSRSQVASTGSFSFDLIPPSTYQIEISATGFRTYRFEHLVALVGTPADASARLEVGSAAETVLVESESAQVHINTQDATLGNNIEGSQISGLPLEGRNVLTLLTLQPGVTPDGYVAGARSDQSNITLDGVDINEAQSSDIAKPVLRLNAEAIEEFRVTTVNSNANEGRSSAAQINLVTKSGTNTWHGAAFEFYRGTLFEANDWFSNAAGVSRTPLVRNTFGGAFGGPILKDRLFFFYSYEGRREAKSEAVTQVVPLPSLGQGIVNYSYCLDSACDSPQTASLNLTQNQEAYADTGINPAALSALADAAARYPANDTTLGDGLNTSGFRFNSPKPVKLNSHFARLDYAISSKQNLFIRMNVIHDRVGNGKFLPDSLSQETWSHPTGLAVGHTWTLGNNWVNSFRYGYTRQAFTDGGDSTGNDISFRFVFQPNNQSHTLSRVTPVHNITDDVSWIHGKHVIQFGTNIRAISNGRTSYANAFDNAITNPSFYLSGGDNVSGAFQSYLDDNGLPGDENSGQSLNSISEVQNAATAIIGRFSEYTADFTFNKAGDLQAAGTPTKRNFATQAYDWYVQDAWKISTHLTLTLGLRYSLERPVYETKGYEVQPTVPLSTYFESRLTAASQGNNFSDPIVINRSGPANGGKSMYDWDKNNFQPRVAVAWSPNFEGGVLHSLFGNAGQSVIRGGFALTNDYYGQALAVDFDLNNTLGFTSNYTTPANTYDTTGGNLAPLFTGFNQDVRSLPKVVVPGNLSFPLSQPLDEGERIESSVDSKLHAPASYVWNLTYERQLRGGFTVSASYIGRLSKSLLARRDVAAFNNVRDPKSGMDWYSAGTLLEKQRQQGIDTSQIADIPFFNNLFPANFVNMVNADPTVQNDCFSDALNPCFDPSFTNTQLFYAFQSRTPSNPYAFFGGNDWTDTEAYLDKVLFAAGSPTRFMQNQYGALSAWSTIGNSAYHAFTFTARQRMKSLMLDVNYTFSHSADDSSGLQTAGAFGSAFITNPINQRSGYGNSDFDIRHLINASAIWEMPFGKGRQFLNTDNKVAQAVIGGWTLSGIFRWNTGLPLRDTSGAPTSPFDDTRWATNWNVQANVTPVSPIHNCNSRTGTPKLFGGTGCDTRSIYQSFRNAYPGEAGPRNYIRMPGYANVDLGLAKSFTMPWSEKHQLQFRWDVFNIANFQPFGGIDGSRTGIGVVRDPARRNSNPPANWSNFTNIQGSPRVMQVGLRYSF